jgi:predicted amidohydrolase YtcJ
MREAIAAMADELNAECMTGAMTPASATTCWPIRQVRCAWDAYRQVLADGDLTVRAFALWRSPGTLDEARQLVDRIAPFTHPESRDSGDRLISGGVKIFADGSGGAHGWVWDDWNRERTGLDEGNRGYPAIDMISCAT